MQLFQNSDVPGLNISAVLSDVCEAHKNVFSAKLTLVSANCPISALTYFIEVVVVVVVD